MSKSSNSKNSAEPDEAMLRDFIDWRYHAREFYENISMLVLPNNPISVHFTSNTQCAKDSYVYGLILGLYDSNTNSSSVSLYNVSFPNRNSILFDKSNPNEKWGQVFLTSEYKYNGQITASDTNSFNDILVSIDDQVIFIGEYLENKVKIENDTVNLIKFTPIQTDSSKESYFCTEKGNLMYNKTYKVQFRPTIVHRFQKPIHDITIDPSNNQVCLAATGDKYATLIDTRDSSKTVMNLNDKILSLSYAPHIPFMFATGSSSGPVSFYDSRYPQGSLFTIKIHFAPVTRIKWSPHQRDVVALCSDDASITLWSINDSIEPDDPDVLFVHNGHLTPIKSFDWCKDMPFTLASVSNDKLFELWTIAPSQIEDYLYPE